MSAAPNTADPIRYSFQNAGRLAEKFSNSRAEDLLRWGMETFGDRLVLASSMGAEDIVLIDLAVAIDPNVRVFTLDTGRLHEETYETLQRVRTHFGIEVEVMFPDRTAVEELIQKKGPNSFYESIDARKECCQIRKVEPLRRILRTADAWATGMRKGQAATRTELRKVELDMLNGGLLKLNPLADWSHHDIWRQIRDRDLPYNRLHDRGFPSIGCAPCTRAVKPGEEERSGRWWWERPDDKECGLHK